MSSCGLHSAERDQYRSLIDESCNVVGLEPPISERHLPDLVLLGRKHPPRVVVRAVLALADHHVLSSAGPAELCSYQARRCRHRRDQGDVRAVGPHQGSHRSPCALACGLATGEVQAVLRPIVDEGAQRGNECSARQSHRRRVEVGRVVRGREQGASVAHVTGWTRRRTAVHSRRPTAAPCGRPGARRPPRAVRTPSPQPTFAGFISRVFLAAVPVGNLERPVVSVAR